MKVYKYDTDEEWKDARMGKITGSKLGDIVVKRGTGKKIGFYQLIADRLAIEEEQEDPMERGRRLEKDALALFAEMTGKKVDDSLVMWVSDDNDGIAYSPDGVVNKTETCEVKCLAAAKHLMAYFEQKVPSEYEFQVLQSFITNEKQKTLWFIFYDTRITVKPIHWLEITRESLGDDIETYKQYQIETLKEVNELTIKLAF